MSMVTEREWRRRAARARQPRRCWGAPCVISRSARLRQDRAFHAFLLLSSLMTALCMPWLADTREKPTEYPVAVVPALSAQPRARAVNDIAYRAPADIAYRQTTFTRAQLVRGKLLLIDAEHPLPPDAPAPNTLSIASYGKGMVPVNGIDLKSGRETIAALTRLFAYARGKGVGDLCVWRATQSPAEQAERRLACMRALCATLPPEEAAARTLAETDAPGTGEALQEYAVEIRLRVPGMPTPDERPLGATDSGRFLTQNAWRFGFIHREPDAEGARGFRFRYVGEAHATAMRFLDLRLEDYLALLRERRVLSVRRDGKLRHIIYCEPMGETHVAFRLPEGAAIDASLDNAGWAVVACTLAE